MMRCIWCKQPIIKNLTIMEMIYPFSLQKQTLCKTCQKKFERLEGGCLLCGKKGQPTICSDCQFWQKKYPDYSFKHEALYRYNDGFQEWIEQYKYQGDYQLRYTFFNELKRYFKDKRNLLVIPIPLSDEKQRKRGFNQVEAILDATNIKYQRFLLKKNDTIPQAKKSRYERLKMAQPFILHVDGKLIENQEIILVDDIYTTGRTLFYAAECLLPYHPKKIMTFSLAR